MGVAFWGMVASGLGVVGGTVVVVVVCPCGWLMVGKV